MKSILDIENISKKYSKKSQFTLVNLSLTVHEGELLSVVGQSGCGKTTLLRCLAGFESIDAGKIIMANQTVSQPKMIVPPEKRGIGFVFQDYALFPHINVEQNIAFGLHRWPREQKRKQVEHMLELTDLGEFRKRYPHQLSGGQQQRVAFARALAPVPKVLLMDEPFSNLDTSLRSQMRMQTKKIIEETGVTGILVTHDQQEALSLSNRIAIMKSGEILQVGSPQELYTTPKDAFTASFLGRANIFNVEGKGNFAVGSFGRIPLKIPAIGEIKICLRPEDIDIEKIGVGGFGDLNSLGMVKQKEFYGDHIHYIVQVTSGEFFDVIGQASQVIEIGDSVSLRASNPATCLSAKSL